MHFPLAIRLSIVPKQRSRLMPLLTPRYLHSFFHSIFLSLSDVSFLIFHGLTNIMPHDNYHLTQCHSQIGDTHRRSEWNASCAAQPLYNISSSHSFSLFLFLPCLACSQPLCNDLCALILALFLMSTEGERFFSQIGRNAGSPFSCVSSLSFFISMSFCSRRRMKYIFMRSLFFLIFIRRSIF